MESYNSYFSLDDFITNNEDVLSNDVDIANNNMSYINSQDLSSWGLLMNNINENNTQIFKTFNGLDSNNIQTPPISNNNPELERKNSYNYINNNNKDIYFENDLYQIISNTPSISSTSSSKELNIPAEQISGASSINSNEFISNQNLFGNSSTIPVVLDFDNLLSDSPIPIINTDYSLNSLNSNNTITNNEIGSAYTSPKSVQIDFRNQSNSSNFQSSEDEFSPQSNSSNNNSTPSTPPDNSNSNISKRRSSLDSRLSLQKLGDILKTTSLEETIKVEKFILNIFVKDLGFPLGYKTWIRDTNGKSREYLLEELYKRVHPTYPELTRSLLETVVKRATYSMMQGRLRKERRAASKSNGSKRSRKSGSR